MRASSMFMILFLLPACSRAQATHEHGGMGSGDEAKSGVDAAKAVHEAMSHDAGDNPHLVLTPAGAANGADSARARKIVAELERGMARYGDYRVALADGYRPFLANVRQPVYHFTSARRAIRASLGFDAAAPTSLLYEKDGSGYRLVGAMYTAPKRASLDELDERVPLSIARWHAHVNICLPGADERGRWRESSGGKMRFGPAGTIATEAECERAGGRWFPQLFGWMVHVNPYESDPARVWGTHDAASQGEAHHGH
jgi:hypothetical protein